MKWIKRLFRTSYIVDVNILPPNYKTNGEVTAKDIMDYENDFNINIFPIDMKPSNTLGSNVALFNKV